MARKVVTNLRIDETDWFQIKAEAGELGMSVNQYINYLLRDLSLKRMLNPKKEAAPIWKLGDLAKKVQSHPMGPLSDEDEIIYG